MILKKLKVPTKLTERIHVNDRHYCNVIHDGTLLKISHPILGLIFLSGSRINLHGDFDFNNTTVENVDSLKYVV